MTSTPLLNLSDELVLHILKYLDSSSLIDCGRTCFRLQNLTCDRILWKTADLCDRRHTCVSLGRQVKPFLALTKSLHVRGMRNSDNLLKRERKLLTKYVLQKITKWAPNLEDFVVKEATFCATEISIKDLSLWNNLKCLSIINCELLNRASNHFEGSWFRNIQSLLPNLECLEIAGSSFISDHDMMTLAKINNLKKLVLTNCIRIGLAMAYIAIAFRFGFSNLEYIDLRGTSIHNNDIQSIVQFGKLRELYIGPMGKVKRQTLKEDIYDLIMADPRREESTTNQVLVVSIGTNGPRCRPAEDKELDSLGLGWVLEQKQRMEQQQKQNACTDHMYIGKNGNIIRPKVNDSPGPSSSKRKAEDEDYVEESNKRIKTDDENGSSDDEESRFGEVVDKNKRPDLNCVHDFSDITPDDELNDYLVNLVIRNKTLVVLHLAGCAITNTGLEILLNGLPSLKTINVMFTLVTQDCVDNLRKLHPHCDISDVRPPAQKTGSCTVFCYP